MREFFPILQKCRLFDGISQADLEKMLNCLPARHKSFIKNSFILTAGEKTGNAGIVLTGAAHIVNDSYEGRRKIIERTTIGGLFVEDFVCANVEKLSVSVVAAEETEVLFIDCKRIVSTCPSACVFHTRLIRNFTILMAEKNISKLQKMEHITQATTREKLLSYLTNEARLAGKKKFTISFNREELAHYLSVERSGLSAELSKMQDDGLIHYQGNQFELLNPQGPIHYA